MDNTLKHQGMQLSRKDRLLQQCLFEKNIIKIILRVLIEPFLMLLYGYMLVLKINILIRALLNYCYSLLGSFAEWLMDMLPEEAGDMAGFALDSAPAIAAKGGVQFKIFQMFHLPRVQVPLYFLVVTTCSMLIYILMFLIFQKCYEQGRFDMGMSIKMLSYRNRRMLIPLLIGALITRLSILLGLISMLVAVIFGCLAVFDVFDGIRPRDKRNGAFAGISILIVLVGRCLLYYSLFFMVIPRILDM